MRDLARMAPCNPGHISNLRSGKARPSAELAEALDERLEAGGSLCALFPAHERGQPQSAASWDDDAAADEIAAFELGRLIEATEVGTGTVKRLERAVDELAIAYPGTPSADLYARVRGYLSDVSRLLDARMTLAEHRRLLVVGGWMSLLQRRKDAPGPGSVPPQRHGQRPAQVLWRALSRQSPRWSK